MIINFPSSQQCMVNVLAGLRRDLEHSASGAANAIRRTAGFADTMAALVGVHAGLCGDDAPTPQELADFEIAVAALLQEDQPALSLYIGETLTETFRARSGGWFEPSLRRSALQLLCDQYPGVANRLSEDNREDLAEIDQTLREVAPDIEPLAEEEIPTGLPESHWWWRLPSGNSADVEEWEMWDEL
ncbi:hypothetical protein ABZV58_27935 [Nocardia sp. NPDC004654]|uniref:hypothetical protein n=1 Tax=Nocardia sp. NPDC004654 TaxID=3154776 RepID=UPI0033AA7F8E